MLWSINIRKNRPLIKKEEVIPNPDAVEGTNTQFNFKGNYVRAKLRVSNTSGRPAF